MGTPSDLPFALPTRRPLTRTHLVPVDVKTWPERADTLVVDARSGRPLVHFPLRYDRGSPVCNILAPRQARIVDALERAEFDQSALRGFLGIPAGKRIRLYERGVRAGLIEFALLPAALSVEQVEFADARTLERELAARSLEQLHQAVVGWFECIERNGDRGSAARIAQGRLHRADPEHPFHEPYFHSLAEPFTGEQAIDDDSAYRLCRELVDVPLELFSLKQLLWRAFFCRSEFPERTPFPLRALTVLPR